MPPTTIEPAERPTPAPRAYKLRVFPDGPFLGMVQARSSRPGFVEVRGSDEQWVGVEAMPGTREDWKILMARAWWSSRTRVERIWADRSVYGHAHPDARAVLYLTAADGAALLDADARTWGSILHDVLRAGGVPAALAGERSRELLMQALRADEIVFPTDGATRWEPG